MARVDFYGSVDGYLFDFGRSRVVGRKPDEAQQRMLDVTRDSVGAGIAAVRPGAALGEVARAANDAFASSAFARCDEALAPEFASWGHSLGLNWEGPFIDADSEVAMEPGMCLAIEKRVAVPGVGGANYEDNVLVTANGCEILTPARTTYESS
jgi:Xaa-Pro aminopeptidase